MLSESRHTLIAFEDMVTRIRLGDRRPLGYEEGSWHLEAIRRYWAGEPISYISEELGRHRETVERVILEAGGEFPGPQIRPGTYRKAKALFKAGETRSAIAKGSGAKRDVIARLFPTAPRVAEKHDWEKISLAVEDGWPQAEICETFGVSRHSLLKRHPGPWRRGGWGRLARTNRQMEIQREIAEVVLGD